MASEKFWNAAQSTITKTENHKFLTSMVNGTLCDEKFVYYVIQDALYLTDFADCLKRLGDNAADTKQKDRLYSLAKGAEEDEKELHRSFFSKWNIESDAKISKQMPKTLLYTSYMLRVVTTRPYAEGLAVLLPCFWVYMHVGKCMLKLRDDLGDRLVLSLSSLILYFLTSNKLYSVNTCCSTFSHFSQTSFYCLHYFYFVIFHEQ